MEYFDTIIIGAGLAGCTLGNLLLNKKQTVMIVESQDLKKKNKLCGGIVTTKAYKLLFKIYGTELAKIDFKKFDTFKVNNNGITKEIKMHSIYTIDRKDLDDFVVNQFKQCGGKVIDNTSYEKIDFKNKIIYTSEKAFKYNHLVGADGVFSKVRNDLTGKRQKMNFAIESENAIKNEIIQIDFFNHFKGYAWTISNNKTNLRGLGDVSQNTDIQNIFLNHFYLKNDIPMRGAFLPTGNNIFLRKGDIFFVGDAAGLISPVSGEGIYYAVSSSYNLSKSMNWFYKVRMWKDRFIIFNHRISKFLIYNTYIRNFFYQFYGKSKTISFLIDLVLKTLL